MFFSLPAALSRLQKEDYGAVVILTAVGYDYVLAFSDEIEYIWKQPWTWVSTLYICVRYFGLYSVIAPALINSSFIHSPAETCKILYIIDAWTFLPFLGAADLAMILRVWSMYDRSRLVLSTLLVLLFAEVVCTIVVAVMFSDPRNVFVTTVQLLNQSFCLAELPSPAWTRAANIVEMTIGAMMCTLAIVQFIVQSLQMYRVTKHWQISRYMNLLVQQGIFYFLAMTMFSLIDAIFASGAVGHPGWRMVLLLALEWVPTFALTPRLILSIRKLYARDVQRRRGEGIDTGFGLSLPGGGPLGMATGSLDAEQNMGLEGVASSDHDAAGTASGFEGAEQNEG